MTIFKRYKRSIYSFLVAGTLLLGSGCASVGGTAKGGAIGAGAGGTIGGIIGNRSENTAEGAIIGAAIGGIAGAAIGKYMDKQEEQFEESLGEDAKIERVGEGIHLTFDSGILFKLNSSKLSPLAKEDIRKMAATLTEYPETDILIEGHTDASGSEAYNLRLSKKRADAVKDYAISLGVSPDRILTKGYGEEEPIATNETLEGRQDNRRVELAIYANEKLKKDAEDGKLKSDTDE